MTHEHNLLCFFPRAYSVRRLQEDSAGTGKRNASYNCIRQEPADSLLFQHYQGTGGAVSVQPILEEGNVCQWGAIDIDSYGDDKLVEQVRQAARIFGVNCFIEQSKSKGVHLYILLDRPTVAKPFRRALQKIAVWLGHPKAEIRPAQDEIDFANSDLGTFMVLPGFGMGFEKAKAAFEAATITIEAFNSLVNEGELSDGPPCLFPLQVAGQQPDGLSKVRNLFMYQMGIFLKYKHPADWQSRLTSYNELGIAKGIPPNELEALIGQLDKNAKCHYRCTGEPFESVCNKTACQFRKFGVASRESASSIISPEGITVLGTDPPVWFATLNNPKNNETVRTKLTTDQLLNVNGFKKRCMEALNCIPTLPKQKDWEAVVSDLLKNAQSLPVPFEMTEEARVLDAIYRFCLTSLKSSSPENILKGRIWYEKLPDDRLFAHFRQVDFTNFVSSSRGGAMKTNEVHTVLSELYRLNHLQMEKLDLGGATVSVYKIQIHSRYLEVQAQIEAEE